MGVYRTDYLMWAANVGAKAFKWDKHEAEMEGRPDRRFDIVYDGMSGEYCMAGKILAVSDENEGFSPKTIDPAELGIDREKLAETVSAAFGPSLGITADDFSLVLFSHYG